MADKRQFRSSIKIEILNNDGSTIEDAPSNVWEDSAYNLTGEQAAAHHYELKKMVASWISQVTSADVAKFTAAATGTKS